MIGEIDNLKFEELPSEIAGTMAAEVLGDDVEVVEEVITSEVAIEVDSISGRVVYKVLVIVMSPVVIVDTVHSPFIQAAVVVGLVVVSTVAEELAVSTVSEEALAVSKLAEEVLAASIVAEEVVAKEDAVS